MRLFTFLAAVALPATVLAQQPGASTAVGTGPGSSYGLANATVRSPEVLPDRRITFRLAAPSATQVVLNGVWPNSPPGVSASSHLPIPRLAPSPTDPTRPRVHGGASRGVAFRRIDTKGRPTPVIGLV